MSKVKLEQQKQAISSFKEDNSGLVNLWLEWQVAMDASDDTDLISFDFKIKKKDIKLIENYKVEIPILALYHLAEKYNWLQVLRSSQHKPKDPYELVSFIKMLDDLAAGD